MDLYQRFRWLIFQQATRVSSRFDLNGLKFHEDLGQEAYFILLEFLSSKWNLEKDGILTTFKYAIFYRFYDIAKKFHKSSQHHRLDVEEVDNTMEEITAAGLDMVSMVNDDFPKLNINEVNLMISDALINSRPSFITRDVPYYKMQIMVKKIRNVFFGYVRNIIYLQAR